MLRYICAATVAGGESDAFELEMLERPPHLSSCIEAVVFYLLLDRSTTMTLNKRNFTRHNTKAHREGLEECISSLKEGDTLLVWRLDRLGRSMPHLVSIVESLRERGVHFKSLHDGIIDTTTASGELIFHIFAALAQFERTLIQERTRAGLEAARARGKKGGRKPIGAQNPKVKMAKAMHKDNSMGINEICTTLSISRATFYRYIKIV